MTIWLTQSLFSARPLLAQLQPLPVNMLPIFTAMPLAVPELQVTPDTWLILTSKTAIAFWCENYPLVNKVIVMGAGSAAFAKACGIKQPVYFEQEGSEGLLSELLLPESAQIIVASAKRRRGLLESELLAQGYKVKSVALYHNQANTINIAQIKPVNGDIVVVASQHAIELLLPVVTASITWVTISDRLKQFFTTKDTVVAAESSIKLAETIHKCYLELKSGSEFE